MINKFTDLPINPQPIRKKERFGFIITFEQILLIDSTLRSWNYFKKKSAEQELKFPAGRLLANRLIHAASQPWRLLALWPAMDLEQHFH